MGLRFLKGRSAVKAMANSPRLAVRMEERLCEVTVAVVWTVRVAVAGWPVTGTVTGSQVAREGSCEQVREMEPVSPPAGVTVRL